MAAKRKRATESTRRQAGGRPFEKGNVPAKPFKAGVSPNPGGLPAWVKEVRELAGAHSREAIERLVALMRQRKQLKVAHAAACAILDRAGARPIQPIALTDENGKARPLYDLSRVPTERLAELEATLKLAQAPAPAAESEE